MSKKLAALFGVIAFAIVVACVAGYGSRKATAAEGEVNASPLDSSADTAVVENGFSVEVLIGGASTTEYAARGRRYVEALENAEYELRQVTITDARGAAVVAVFADSPASKAGLREGDVVVGRALNVQARNCWRAHA